MALSIVWTGMLVLAIACACALGTVPQTAAAMMDGAQKGVSLSLSLAGILCLWSGACQVMEAAGISSRIARLLRPLLRRLTPGCTPEAMEAAAANVSANLLGLGNAATPLGIEAVRRMRRDETATDAMCRFAAVRGAAGAAAPFDILPAVWLTSAAALAVGQLAAWALGRVWNRRGW